ncbi:hypothetical protein [Sedimentibacter sp.]|uniref:hypothetical protein n=1 Tax=Sedimentibacter sp. TaxID=1960295 RepID=UPI0028A8E8A7|nr:hypothetical protein [Sedimentibacter sp.]
MKTKAAFFDIDGTIFRNSLMIEHFQKLITFELIDPEVWYTKVKKVYLEWEKRYGDFEEYLEILAGVYLDELKGFDKSYCKTFNGTYSENITTKSKKMGLILS